MINRVEGIHWTITAGPIINQNVHCPNVSAACREPPFHPWSVRIAKKQIPQRVEVIDNMYREQGDGIQPLQNHKIRSLITLVWIVGVPSPTVNHHSQYNHRDPDWWAVINQRVSFERCSRHRQPRNIWASRRPQPPPFLWRWSWGIGGNWQRLLVEGTRDWRQMSHWCGERRCWRNQTRMLAVYDKNSTE